MCVCTCVLGREPITDPQPCQHVCGRATEVGVDYICEELRLPGKRESGSS